MQTSVLFIGHKTNFAISAFLKGTIINNANIRVFPNSRTVSKVHYQYTLKRDFSTTMKLPIPRMRRIHKMDILMRTYLLNIKFGELPLINVALKT